MTPTAFPNYVATLAQAGAALKDKSVDRPDSKTVVNALLQAEKAAKQQRLTYPLEVFLGEWRLCFSAPRNPHLQGGKPIGRGFYVPQISPAQIAFSPLTSATHPRQLEIGNQIQLGPLLLRLTGPAQYVGKKNLLMFDFSHLLLSLFGRTVYRGAFREGEASANAFAQPSVAKPPFFAFFLATDHLIAARGRGGGLALWVAHSASQSGV